MTTTNYYDYQMWAQAQAADTPGMSYDADTARFVVNGTKPFPTYLQAKWYYDYIYKFGGNPLGVEGFLPGFGADLKNSTFIVGSVKADSFADTFTHAATTNATMVDSDGLLKWRPHNLLTYSEDFSNAAWSKNGVTAEASSLTEDTSTGTHRVLNANGISVSAVLHTNAIEVKPNGRTRVRLTNNNLAGSTFDLVGSGSVVSGSGTITSLEDGWYRIYSEIVSSTIERLVLYLDDGTGTSYTGDGVSGVYVRKAHLYRSDLGGMVNNPDRGDSYVPTTSAAVYMPRRGHHIWDGSAWVDAGYLHESEARTNQITYSENFSNAAWSKTGITTEATDANGYTPLVETDTSLGHYTFQDSALTVGIAYTMSLDVRARENTLVQIATSSGFSTSYINFDLSSGTIGSGSISGTITKIGPDEYRVSATDIAQGGLGRMVVALIDSDATGRLPNYTGTSGNGILTRRIQFEAGSTPSSYIPTNGATATRAAETLTAPSANLPWPTPQVIGDELVTNGTFDTDTSGWTDDSINGGSVAYSSGTVELTAVAAGVGGQLFQEVPTVVGRCYRLTVDRPSGLVIVQAPNYQSDNNAGTVTAVFVAASTTSKINVLRYNAGTGAVDNISVREINPLAVSIQMEGTMTYADEGEVETVIPFSWQSGTPRLFPRLRTDSTRTGAFQFVQNAGDGEKAVLDGSDTYSPGVNIPFSIASRHGSTFINGAVDGTALTENSTPVALPDLSSTDMEIGYDFMGTIKTLRIWADDIGDAGLEASTT